MCDKERPGCPTVFLDRDGTINEEVNYLHRPEDLRLLPGAAQAIRMWNENGFRVVVVTNQAGVARGYYHAVALIRTMVEDVQKATGNYRLKEYFQAGMENHTE